MKIGIKRVYEPAAAEDGKRILVDRLWPRGIRRDRIAAWCRDAAPSNALRTWYQHQPDRWPEFIRRYHAELDGNPDAVAALRKEMDSEVVTLLFSSREQQLNNAEALRLYLER